MSGPVVLVLRLGLAIALYGFLGFALYTLWRDFSQQAVLLSRRRIPGIKLSIQSGTGPVRLRQFDASEISLGRSPACDVPLDDETISARHGLLTFHHGQWWLEDLASTNGTRLNDIPVSMPTVVTTGDVIACGQARLIIDLNSGFQTSSDGSEQEK